MKKIIAFLLVGMLALTGCSKGSNKTKVEDPKNNEKVAEYAKLVSEDKEVVDGVITGKYYKIPCSLKEFSDNGWVEDIENNENKSIEEIQLKPNGYIELDFINNEKTADGFDKKITLVLLNEGSETQKITGDTQVVEVSGDAFDLDAQDFVSKNGISLNSKISDVTAAFKDVKSYSEDEYEGVLVDRNQVNIVTFSFDDTDKIVDKIILSALDVNGFDMYKDPADIEKETAEKKSLYEKDSANYLPNNYDGLVTDLKTKLGKSVNLYIEGTVTDYISVTSGYSVLEMPSGQAYLITDSNGKTFALSKPYSDKFNLGVGDTVQVWATSNEVLQMDDAGTEFIPYLTTDIININGTEAYNYFS